MRRLIRYSPRAVLVAAFLGLAGVAVAGTVPGILKLSVPPIANVGVEAPIMFATDNSKLNQAVLSAPGMLPGQSVSGDLTITSKGLLGGRYTLSPSNLVDTPGPNGGHLPGRLQLTIDANAGRSQQHIYTGTLAALGRLDIGPINAGESKTFRFTVTLPNGGTPPSPTTGDNAYQGSTAKVTLTWTGTSCPLATC